MEELIPTLPSNIKNIGMKISGGADSAIVCYALSKYIFDNNTNQKIIPITVNQEGKAYQEKHAKKVINFCKQTFDKNIFLDHVVGYNKDAKLYSQTQDGIVMDLYKNRIIDCHFTGITKNPPAKVYETFGHIPPDDRSDNIIRPLKRNNAYRPLTNLNKKQVKEYYDYYGVLDTLFPLTRSCEDFTNDFSSHCKTCWFCQERYWGFGRYE